MCRIFGFRSIIKSKVHQSLVYAENALQVQSHNHPDGWGLVYYVQDSPHVVKSVASAYRDHLFPKISGVVSSQTFLAHVRFSTQGEHNILNTHPFQYGPWVLAHNGNIKNFDQYREKIMDRIDEELKTYILGQTDSELIFYFILQSLKDKNLLFSTDASEIMKTIKPCLKDLISIIGPLDNDDGNQGNYLTFVLAKGDILIGFNGGKDLKYSTYKSLCPERDSCSMLAPICEKKADEGDQVKHLLFTSEPIEGANVWLDMSIGEMIGVDEGMI